jgi:hypothetical protein
MTTSISDSGLVLASGNLIDLRATVPSSGSYVAGDIVLESTTTARISGWKRLTTGSGHVLNTDWLYFSGIGSGTPVATTSGTSIDFTGVPAGVRRITVLFDTVSTNGNSLIQIQVGSGAIVTSGYTSQGTASSSSSGVITTGLCLLQSTAAATAHSGHVIITSIQNNKYVMSSNLAAVNGTQIGQYAAGATPTLGGALDRLRITTVGGTDTFDAGSINILWEF